MKPEAKKVVAKELLVLAKEIAAFDDEPVGSMVEEVEDPRFAEKVRTLRQSMPVITRKKNKRLRQFGIGLLRPNDTVESLIDALLKVVQAGG